MNVVMLAAGLGTRRGFTVLKHPPKVLPRFAADIERANAEVPPRILMAGGHRRAAMTIDRDMARGKAQRL